MHSIALITSCEKFDDIKKYLNPILTVVLHEEDGYNENIDETARQLEKNFLKRSIANHDVKKECNNFTVENDTSRDSDNADCDNAYD